MSKPNKTTKRVETKSEARKSNHGPLPKMSFGTMLSSLDDEANREGEAQDAKAHRVLAALLLVGQPGEQARMETWVQRWKAYNTPDTVENYRTIKKDAADFFYTEFRCENPIKAPNAPKEDAVIVRRRNAKQQAVRKVVDFCVTAYKSDVIEQFDFADGKAYIRERSKLAERIVKAMKWNDASAYTNKRPGERSITVVNRRDQEGVLMISWPKVENMIMTPESAGASDGRGRGQQNDSEKRGMVNFDKPLDGLRKIANAVSGNPSLASSLTMKDRRITLADCEVMLKLATMTPATLAVWQKFEEAFKFARSVMGKLDAEATPLPKPTAEVVSLKRGEPNKDGTAKSVPHPENPANAKSA